MTRDEIQKLAGHRTVSPWIMKLVYEAIALEREACAKVCEENADDGTEGEWDTACINCADRIRDRGQA